MSQLSDKILRIMTENNISFAELALRTGFVESVVQRYAKGQVKIPTDRIPRIARALGRTPSELLDWDTIEKAESDPINDQLNAIRRAYLVSDMPTRRAVCRVLDVDFESADIKTALSRRKVGGGGVLMI